MAGIQRSDRYERRNEDRRLKRLQRISISSSKHERSWCYFDSPTGLPFRSNHSLRASATIYSCVNGLTRAMRRSVETRRSAAGRFSGKRNERETVRSIDAVRSSGVEARGLVALSAVLRRLRGRGLFSSRTVTFSGAGWDSSCGVSRMRVAVATFGFGVPSLIKASASAGRSGVCNASVIERL
jgi:hypothetical protein